MALKILWTPRAAKGYAQIVDFLEKRWTTKQVQAFQTDVGSFMHLLAQYPYMLIGIQGRKNYRRGPINKHTMLTYRVRPRKGQIELLNFRSTRQTPLDMLDV